MLKAISIPLQPQIPNTKKEKSVPSKGFVRNGATIEGIFSKPSITGRREKFGIINGNPNLNPEGSGNVTIPKNMGYLFHLRIVNA